MNNIKASVLIINYNNEKYISECVNSIKNQSYKKKIEIIFHDDNSTDKSLNVIKKYKNIKVIQNKLKSNQGSYNQIAAIKRSFAFSKGKIIFLLDSDDYFTKDKVKKVLKIFSRKKNLNIVYDLPIEKRLLNLKKIIPRKKNFERFWPYIPPQSCISLRRSVFKKMISKVEIKRFPDIWIDFRIAIYAKYILKNFYVLEKNLTIYRKTSNSASSKFKKFSKNWWKRRFQAHQFVKFFFKKYKIKYNKNLDYFLTSIAAKMIK